MQSKNLYFESLTAAHADDLFSILTTSSVLAFIAPTEPPTLEDLRAEYAVRARGPVNSMTSTEQWSTLHRHVRHKCLGRPQATRTCKTTVPALTAFRGSM